MVKAGRHTKGLDFGVRGLGNQRFAYTSSSSGSTCTRL